MGHGTYVAKVTCARTAIRGQSIVLHFALRHVPGTGHDTDRVRADNLIQMSFPLWSLSTTTLARYLLDYMQWMHKVQEQN